VILLDADILLIDCRYQRDEKYATNRLVLDRLRSESRLVGITQQAFLETLGVLSFSVSPSTLEKLARQLILQYRLIVIPEWSEDSSYGQCQLGDLIQHMQKRMALGDAVQAAQIECFSFDADCLLTWNAKHFAGKLAVSVLTPEDWLRREVIQQ